jgi:hypothetical protein
MKKVLIHFYAGMPIAHQCNKTFLFKTDNVDKKAAGVFF